MAADNDARVLRMPTMESHEMQSVVRQQRTLFSRRCGEHFIILHACPGKAEHRQGEDIVTE